LVSLWQRQEGKPSAVFGATTEWTSIEIWNQVRQFRGGGEDVTDISWSPNSMEIACGSIDRRVRIWSVPTGRCLEKNDEHTNYVQGIAFDPLNSCVVSQSADRYVTL
jgi:chromatin assembly factor 1 subunit B